MVLSSSSLGSRLALLCLTLCLVSAGADQKKKLGRAKGPTPAPPGQGDEGPDGGGVLPPPPRRVTPAPPPLVNLTGTYRGEWQLASAWPPRLRGSGPLQHGSGVVVVKLRAAVGDVSPCARACVHVAGGTPDQPRCPPARPAP